MDDYWITTPAPDIESTEEVLDLDLDDAALLEQHVFASVDSQEFGANLLKYNFNADLIPYMASIPLDVNLNDYVQNAASELNTTLTLSDLFRESSSAPDNVVPLETLQAYPLLSSLSSLKTAAPTKAALLPCGWTDKGIFSFKHAIVRNVISAEGCQILCQSFTEQDALGADQCANVTSNRLETLWNNISALFSESATQTDQQCAGVTYIPHEHTCVLHASVDAIFDLEGFYSAPSVCKGGSILSKDVATACLQKVMSKVYHFQDESLLTEWQTSLEWSPTKEFIATWPTTLISSGLNHITSDAISDPRSALGEVIRVHDVRDCMLLCATDATCQRWNFVADDHIRVCYKDVHSNSRVFPLGGNLLMTIWGTAEHELPISAATGRKEEIDIASLYSATIRTSWQKAQTFADPQTTLPRSSCEFIGYAAEPESVLEPSFITEMVYKTTLNNRLMTQAGTYDECKRSCLAKIDCRAWHYFGGQYCSLHLLEFPKMYPMLMAASNRSIVGFNRGLGLNLDAYGTNTLLPLCWDKMPPASGLYSPAKYVEHYVKNKTSSIRQTTPEPESRVFLAVGDDDASTGAADEDSKPSETCFDGVGKRFLKASIRGQLTEDENTGILDTSDDCMAACRDHDQCLAWSFGTWGGCSLFQQLDELIFDPYMVSGIVDCKYYEQIQKYSNGGLITHQDGSATSRAYTTCSTGRLYHTYIGSGFKQQFKDTFNSVQECWEACRETHGCAFSTYVTMENRTNCVLLEYSPSMSMVEYRIGAAMPADCDAYGTRGTTTDTDTCLAALMAFQAGSLANNTPANWILLVSIFGTFGVFLICYLVFYVLRVHRDKRLVRIVTMPEY